MATTSSLLPYCQFCMAVNSSVLLRKVCGKQRPTANHSARNCPEHVHVGLLRQLELEKTHKCEPPAMYFPTISVQLHHNKWPCSWESRVDVLAEIWKLLVAVIEMSDGFFGVVSMIFLMLLASRTRRETMKKRSQKQLVASPQNLQKLKTCLQISASFSFFCNLEIYKTSLHTRFPCSQSPAFK